MADFPAKRRKTGDSSSAIPADDAPSSPTVNNKRSRPSISYRQSFQSPTRSSLARSNPEVLSHVLSRSPIRSPLRQQSTQRESGFGLRDKKAIRPSLTGFEGAIGAAASQNALNIFSGISPRRGSGAFAVPPRRISRAAGTPVVESSSSPVKTRQLKDTVLTTPSKHPDPDEQLASELDSATRELEHSGLLDPSTLPDDYVEPELPPTPTQLGLEQRPERGGRDLLNSPSAGRGQRKAPLGPSSLGSAVDLAVPERDPEERQVPEAVRKKEAMKSELESQLDKLKADVAQLEKWALQAKQGTDSSQLGQDAVANLISLLSSSNDTTYDPLSRLLAPETPPFSALISSLLPFSKKSVPTKKDTASSEPKNSFALEKTDEFKRYLTIFAPLNLTYTSKLSVPDPASAVTEIHEIILSAQAPFPQYLYSIPLTFTTELQSERILSISLMNKTTTSSTQSKIPPGLQAWIKSRLASPLLKLDISGLCAGICQFWETSICRARMWAALREKSEMLAQGKKLDERSSITQISLLSEQPITKSTLRSLIPHLQRSSMPFVAYGANNNNNNKRKQDSPKILLSCPLDLDHWTGEARLKPEISIFAPDLVQSKRNKAERDMKQLFHNLLRTGASSDSENDGSGSGRQMEAIVKATEAVIGIFFGLDSLSRTNNA
ncbi:Structural maintenance of chromosomes protein 1A [Talaromyces islandicus]|uniref:Structural maintenance of chromosomes protein 1A n=1 Tax=Talaromyces islandicus TaxID=28573 RepID=A0A0U1MCC6_TALIS|nr:Structural maintenance of chromosomes protein 1A [Talaromyces islandicus]